uniref:RAB11 family interacting protein 3 n=1 Tax=Callorhinchus milii TaxID=7868 RepID=A0A4W3HW33_CALMI
ESLPLTSFKIPLFDRVFDHPASSHPCPPPSPIPTHSLELRIVNRFVSMLKRCLDLFQVKELTKYLDPTGLGVIAFDDFCRGIAAIRSNGDSDSQTSDMGLGNEEDVAACADEFEDFAGFEPNEVSDSAYMGSESTYSECETFTDEDTGTLVHPGMHDDVETDSATDATLNSEHTDMLQETDNGLPFNGDSGIHQHDFFLDSNMSLEGTGEHFEDYGENDEIGFASSSLCQDGASPMNGHLECSALLVTFLEKRVTELEKDSATHREAQSRLRHENLQLVHRANALEEQLKEQENHSEQMLVDEIRRQKEALSKVERERDIEIENLQARLLLLDEETGELRACIPCFRANIQRLEEEKRRLLDEVEDVSQKLSEEQKSNQKLSDKVLHQCQLFQREKEGTQELIEDLRKQLEHLQLFKLDVERGRSYSAGRGYQGIRTREAELEHEVKRLKQDNRALKEQNDELNGQIINLSIQGAKSLFTASMAESLASEISSVSRDELMDAIHKQEEINYRLQDYIDRIIVAIMETNPSILEIKHMQERT